MYFLFLQLQCCGAYGGVNDTHSWAVYKDHSAWKGDQTMRKFNVLKFQNIFP